MPETVEALIRIGIQVLQQQRDQPAEPTVCFAVLPAALAVAGILGSRLLRRVRVRGREHLTASRSTL